MKKPVVGVIANTHRLENRFAVQQAENAICERLPKSPAHCL